MSSETPTATEPKQETIAKPPAAEKIAAEPKLDPVPASNGYADRNAFLSLIGDLAEGDMTFTTTKGKEIKLLVREITGKERADLITLQAAAYQKGELDMVNYERKMLIAGIIDPESPEGARQPLLKSGDADALMGLGASKVALLVAKIEELSAMGVVNQTRVEGNSATTPSGDSTSA
jgi:hypothetical protein